MKLNDSTFAIIAEKKDSISHKWFNENAKCNSTWMFIGEHYIYDRGANGGILTEKPIMNIYTESEFEALLKAEQRKDFHQNNISKLMLTSLQIEAIQNPKNYTVVWAKDGNGKIINKEGAWCYNNKWIFIESEGLRNLPPKMTQEQYEKINILKAEQEEEAPKTAIWDKSEIPTTQNAAMTYNQSIPQITISYNLAIEYIAEKLNVDKGIIKIDGLR